MESCLDSQPGSIESSVAVRLNPAVCAMSASSSSASTILMRQADAVEILNERQAECLLIRRFPNDRRDARNTRAASRPPAAFAGDQLPGPTHATDGRQVLDADPLALNCQRVSRRCSW